MDKLLHCVLVRRFSNHHVFKASLMVVNIAANFLRHAYVTLQQTISFYSLKYLTHTHTINATY